MKELREDVEHHWWLWIVRHNYQHYSSQSQRSHTWQPYFNLLSPQQLWKEPWLPIKVQPSLCLILLGECCYLLASQGSKYFQSLPKSAFPISTIAASVWCCDIWYLLLSLKVSVNISFLTEANHYACFYNEWACYQCHFDVHRCIVTSLSSNVAYTFTSSIASTYSLTLSPVKW